MTNCISKYFDDEPEAAPFPTGAGPAVLAALTDIPPVPGRPGVYKLSCPFAGGGVAYDVDACLLGPGVAWADQPERADPRWGVGRLGPYTLALRHHAG